MRRFAWSYSSERLCKSELDSSRDDPADIVRARYFCTGMLDIAKYSHWALNAPLYTHFTVSTAVFSLNLSLIRSLLSVDT